jgi:hypothetical protein
MCKKAPHKSQTCEEAAEKVQIKARARVEDAMTAAVVRNCPGCGKAFFKVEGCNKMKCPSCKTLSCYLCRQEIADYTHFCQTFNCSHDSCGACILFTNSERDDRRARREAGLKELENAGNAAADAGLLIYPSPNKIAKARRRPLEPVRNLAENGRRPLLERGPNRVPNARRPQQQRALEAHEPADAAIAVAPENGRRAPIPVPNPRPPQQQRALEAHVRADAPAVAVAPENARYWTYSVCTICLISVCVCFSVTQHFAFGIPSDCNSREKEVCSNIQRLFKLSAARLTPTAQTSDSQAFLHMQYHPRQIRHSVLELYRDICLKTFHASVNTDNQPTGIGRLIIAHSRPTSFRDLLCSTKMVQPENERAGKFWKRSSSRR